MIDLKNRKISISDIAAGLTEPSWLFREPDIPEEVLDENKKLQYRFGLDEADEYVADLFGWTIHFRPDAVDDSYVYEFKVARRFSNVVRLKKYAYIQSLLAAYLTNKKFARILIFGYDNNNIIDDEVVEVRQEVVDALLEKVKKLFSILEDLGELNW